MGDSAFVAHANLEERIDAIERLLRDGGYAFDLAVVLLAVLPHHLHGLSERFLTFRQPLNAFFERHRTDYDIKGETTT